MSNTPKPNKKIRVGIFFGGKSAEHEVSLQSAKNVLEALDTTLFEPLLIGIDKAGDWHLQDVPQRREAGAHAALLVDTTTRPFILSTNKNELIDVAFPVLHGPFGEDGTIQGLFELAGIPYVGPGVLGSAIGMDKDVMKRLLRDAGIPITPFKTFAHTEKDAIVAADVFKELGGTIFVKPANMGSSIGVAKAQTAKELSEAVTEAFAYDTKIIIESAVEGDEIECAILGNEHPRASVLGRIIPHKGDFYSYEAKYIDNNGATLEIPAKLSDEVSNKARDVALKTFKVLNCEGMGRVDMFVTKEGEVMVNEINTIPGFTKISMYPKLWEASGISYKGLITRLIELAMERYHRG